MPHMTIALIIQDRTGRSVDRQLFSVDTETRDLRVEVREVPSLERGIIAESNTGNYVSRTERSLFGLGKEFVQSLIQSHFTYDLKGHELFGPNLGRIQNIEVEVVLTSFGNDLNGKLPLGISTAFDGLFQIFAMEICREKMTTDLYYE